MTFDSRAQAGQLLGKKLKRARINADIVYGLARGGVAVAAEIARILNTPLQALVVRKIGAPGNPEYAVGAIALVPQLATEGNTSEAKRGGRMHSSEVEEFGGYAIWWNQKAIGRLNLDKNWRKNQVEAKIKEIKEYQKRLFHSGNGINGVVLVDDGAATAATMMAAINSFPLQNKVVALPVASTEAVTKLRHVADQLIVLYQDNYLGAISQHYHHFTQVSWGQVRRLLLKNNHRCIVKRGCTRPGVAG